jgi:hypothetical protein
MIRLLMNQLAGLATNFDSPFRDTVETDPVKAFNEIKTDFKFANQTAGEALKERFPSGSRIAFSQAVRKTEFGPNVSPYLVAGQKEFIINNEFIRLRNAARQEAIDDFFEGKTNRVGKTFFGGIGGRFLADVVSQGRLGLEMFGGAGHDSPLVRALGLIQLAEGQQFDGNLSDRFLSLGGLIEKAKGKGYTIKRGFAANNILTSSNRSFGRRVTIDTMEAFAAANGLTTAQFATFVETGSATAAVQRAVGTPQHILIRARQRDARMKTLEYAMGSVFANLSGNRGVVLGRSASQALKRAGGGEHIERVFGFIIDALREKTESGISRITQRELGELGYNLPAVRQFINTVGNTRYNHELDRLRKHKKDIERFNERLIAESSGVGGF